MKRWLPFLFRCLLTVLVCAASASARGAGQVTHTFDYDADGNVNARTGTTPNLYLFTGQQFDPDLGLYYLRARYHNPDSGRFWSADAFEGFASDPASLHRYTFNQNDPGNRIDPSGNTSLGELGQSSLIRSTISFSLFGAVNGTTEAILTDRDPVLGALGGALTGAVVGASFGVLGGPAALASLPAGYWGSAQGIRFLAVMAALGTVPIVEALGEHEYDLAAYRYALNVLPLYGAGRSITAKEVAYAAESSIVRPRPTMFPAIEGPSNTPQLTSLTQIVSAKLTGRFTYVVLPGPRIALGRVGLADFANKHLDLSGGRPVIAAGEVVFKDGKIVFLDGSSGHYNSILTPSQRAVQASQAVSAFNENGAPATGRYVESH